MPGKTIPGGPDPVSGNVTGRMNVEDRDGDALSYTLASPPSRGGTVSFDQQTGSFTYTPSQAARDQAAGTSGLDYDTFGVSISDGIATVQTSVTVQVAQTLPPTTSITNSRSPREAGPSGAVALRRLCLRHQLRQQQRHRNRHRDKPIRENPRCRGGSAERGGQPGSATQPVYVSNSLSNTVSVINASTNTVIGPPIPINVLPGSYINPEEGNRHRVSESGDRGGGEWQPPLRERNRRPDHGDRHHQ